MVKFKSDICVILILLDKGCEKESVTSRFTVTISSLLGQHCCQRLTDKYTFLSLLFTAFWEKT